jgi:DNA-binding transcriptional ArsR family regulator
MKTENAIRAFDAMSTDVRLSVVRLLARAGSKGLASGEIARKLNVPANSLSQQLSLLSTAGLVHQERDGRNVFYKVDFDAIKRLIKFLAVDCAAGHVKGVRIDG